MSSAPETVQPLDIVLLVLISTVAAAFVLVALRKIFQAAVATWAGLYKLVQFLALTYDLAWRVSGFIVNSVILIVVLLIFYSVFFDKWLLLRASLELVKSQPLTGMVVQKAQDQLVVFDSYRQAYWYNYRY